MGFGMDSSMGGMGQQNSFGGQQGGFGSAALTGGMGMVGGQAMGGMGG